MAKKYIDSEKLIAEIEKRIIEHRKSLKKDITSISEATLKGSLCAYKSIEHFIDSLQQDPPEKYIELNGIKYRKVPAKTNDKICKDCDYFLDNGTCNLVDCCPCIDDDTILERLQEQPEVDIEKEIIRYQREDMDRDTTVGDVARHFYGLGLKAKEENK